MDMAVIFRTLPVDVNGKKMADKMKLPLFFKVVWVQTL